MAKSAKAKSFPVVRDRNTVGGLCVCIRHGLFQSVMTDSGNKAEFITVRLNGNTSNDHIRIILAYSPQENDIQGVTDFYQNLSVQIVILVGDFNAKLGSEIITGDPHPMSSSGKLLYEFYTKYNLHLLNSSDVCTGVLTRIQQCKGKIEKSTIDYLFVSAGLVSGVISVQIDEEKVITPWRIVRGGQKKFTDHCAIKFDLNLKALTHEQTSKQRVKVWNFNDKKGWGKFHELTLTIKFQQVSGTMRGRMEITLRSIIRDGG